MTVFVSDRATDCATDCATDWATDCPADPRTDHVLSVVPEPEPEPEPEPFAGKPVGEQTGPAAAAVVGPLPLRAGALPARQLPSSVGWRRLGRLRRLTAVPQAGMSTAEYAVGMLAACGFAGLLLKVLTSSTVSGLLTGLVKRALTLVG